MKNLNYVSAIISLWKEGDDGGGGNQQQKIVFFSCNENFVSFVETGDW